MGQPSGREVALFIAETIPLSGDTAESLHPRLAMRWPEVTIERVRQALRRLRAEKLVTPNAMVNRVCAFKTAHPMGPPASVRLGVDDGSRSIADSMTINAIEDRPGASIPALARHTGLSENSVRRSLKSLRASKHVVKTEDGGYRLNAPTTGDPVTVRYTASTAAEFDLDGHIAWLGGDRRAITLRQKGAKPRSVVLQDVAEDTLRRLSTLLGKRVKVHVSITEVR